jgi:hypothetical protein
VLCEEGKKDQKNFYGTRKPPLTPSTPLINRQRYTVRVGSPPACVLPVAASTGMEGGYGRSPLQTQSRPTEFSIC